MPWNSKQQNYLLQKFFSYKGIELLLLVKQPYMLSSVHMHVPCQTVHRRNQDAFTSQPKQKSFSWLKTEKAKRRSEQSEMKLWSGECIHKALGFTSLEQNQRHPLIQLWLLQVSLLLLYNQQYIVKEIPLPNWQLG